MTMRTLFTSALLLLVTGVMAYSQHTAGQNVHSLHPLAPGDENWDNRFGNTINGPVYAVAVQGKDVYIGGVFNRVGEVAAKNIAHWNGSEWQALGNGIEGFVAALAIDGSGNLYVGGSFGIAGDIFTNNVARWNGSAWQALNDGISGSVFALSIHDGMVYAGGRFITIGSDTVNNIARWNGSAWQALDHGLRRATAGPSGFGQVNTLAWNGTTLIAGGDFMLAGTDTVRNIAGWNGSAWEALGSGIAQPVITVTSAGGAPITSYETEINDTTTINRIIRFDQTSQTWQTIDSTGSLSIRTIIARNDTLFTSGIFQLNDTTVAPTIATYDMTNKRWSTITEDLLGTANALALVDGGVVAGGVFNSTGGVNIARLAGTDWVAVDTAMHEGIVGDVRTIVINNGSLYIGGSFEWAGTTHTSAIARWDGTHWNGIGGGIAGQVDVISIDNGNIYVGGRFGMASDVAAVDAVYWNGTEWIPMALNTTGRILSILPDGNDVYVGGGFTSLNDTTIHGIARWNLANGTWAVLDSGVRGSEFPTIHAMVKLGNDIIVAGRFDSAGQVPAANVARWDGTAWEPMGDGLNDIVKALVIGEDGTLYAGGEFTASGSQPTLRIARWNGSEWIGIEGAPNGPVQAMAIADGKLTVGGLFTTAGDISMFPWLNIAQLDLASGTWSTFGSGISDGANGVRAVAMDGDEVYAGGDFTVAGGKPSFGFAHWHSVKLSVESPDVPATQTLISPIIPNPIRNAATIKFTLPHSGLATISICSALGEDIQTITTGEFPSGEHIIQWNADDLPNGTYFCTLQFDGTITTQRVMLVR